MQQQLPDTQSHKTSDWNYLQRRVHANEEACDFIASRSRLNLRSTIASAFARTCCTSRVTQARDTYLVLWNVQVFLVSRNVFWKLIDEIILHRVLMPCFTWKAHVFLLFVDRIRILRIQLLVPLLQWNIKSAEISVGGEGEMRRSSSLCARRLHIMNSRGSCKRIFCRHDRVLYKIISPASWIRSNFTDVSIKHTRSRTSCRPKVPSFWSSQCWISTEKTQVDANSSTNQSSCTAGRSKYESLSLSVSLSLSLSYFMSRAYATIYLKIARVLALCGPNSYFTIPATCAPFAVEHQVSRNFSRWRGGNEKKFQLVRATTSHNDFSR